jgi:hypothetical protein
MKYIKWALKRSSCTGLKFGTFQVSRRASGISSNYYKANNYSEGSEILPYM